MLEGSDFRQFLKKNTLNCKPVLGLTDPANINKPKNKKLVNSFAIQRAV